MVMNFLCMLLANEHKWFGHSIAVGIVVNGVLRTLDFQR